MLFCVFAGYSVLTYANDYLTYWLLDRIKTIHWLWNAFSLLGMSSLLKMHKKYTRFYRFLLFTPVSVESSQFWSMWMTFSHLITSSTKLAHYRHKIRKVIEFFYATFALSHDCNVWTQCMATLFVPIVKCSQWEASTPRGEWENVKPL